MGAKPWILDGIDDTLVHVQTAFEHKVQHISMATLVILLWLPLLQNLCRDVHQEVLFRKPPGITRVHPIHAFTRQIR